MHFDQRIKTHTISLHSCIIITIVTIDVGSGLEFYQDHLGYICKD